MAIGADSAIEFFGTQDALDTTSSPAGVAIGTSGIAADAIGATGVAVAALALSKSAFDCSYNGDKFLS